MWTASEIRKLIPTSPEARAASDAAPSPPAAHPTPSATRQPRTSSLLPRRRGERRGPVEPTRRRLLSFVIIDAPPSSVRPGAGPNIDLPGALVRRQRDLRPVEHEGLEH